MYYSTCRRSIDVIGGKFVSGYEVTVVAAITRNTLTTTSITTESKEPIKLLFQNQMTENYQKYAMN